MLLQAECGDVGLYFIAEAHISALAGRIFVILVPFDRNLLRIFGYIQTSDTGAS